MARFQGTDGVVVETFDDVDIVFPPPGLRRSGAVADTWEAAEILRAASGGLVTRVDIAPSKGTVPPERRGSSGAEAAKPVSLEVPVGDDQLAALLVETEGVFQWRFPEPPLGVPPTVPVGRRGIGGPRTLRFRVGDPTPVVRPGTRGGFADLVGDAIFDRVRVYVLRFAARKAVASVRDYLERDLVEGLVDMKAAGLDGWKPAQAPVVPVWPQGRPGRLLLMIHGTFSTTVGSFGALGASAGGVAFLADARKHYDAIVGYDHSTLAADPKQNAEAIVRAIDSLQPPNGATVDIVAYSRGGLVARILAEGLLAKRLPSLQVGRVVYIGCTNGGTALAEPENWRSLIDLTTNLAALAGRGLALAGQGLAGTILRESVKTIGGLVQAVVDNGLDDREVAGLAAMRPKSDLIRELDAAGDEPASLPDYYVLGSHYQPRLFAAGGVAPPRGMSSKLALTLANFAANGVMKEANDLVVDNAGMESFGARAKRLKSTEIWGDNTVVYHLNYFQQAEILQGLRGFLLADPATSESIVSSPLPLFNSEQTVADAQARRAEVEASAAVVIERDLGGRPAFYVRARSIFLDAIGENSTTTPLYVALDLREDGVAASGESLPATLAANGFVLTSKGALIGVVPPLGAFLGQATAAGGGAPPVAEIAAARQPVRRRGGRDDELVARRVAPDALPTVPPPVPVAPLEPIDCKVKAEMAPAPPLDRDVPLSVTISREALAATAGAATAVGQFAVGPQARLTIDVTAAVNCVVVGLAKIEVGVPAAGHPDVYDFTVRGLAAGQGEIWVDVRDGLRRLERLVLQPVFVATETLKASAAVATNEPDLPVVTLRIYDLAQGDQAFSLLFQLESRDLGFLLQKQTEVFNFSREKYVGGIYKKLESAWIASSRDLTTFMIGLIPEVAALYEAIVPREIRQALWDYRKNIGSIEVMSQEPFIPWEILPLVEPGKQLEPEPLFLAELGLVRWIANSGFAPATLHLRGNGAYHVIPEYADTRLRLAGAADEQRMVVDLLASRPAPVNSVELVGFLRAGDFDLLHFACHGNVANTSVYNANLEMQGRYDPDAQAYIPDALTVNQVKFYANLKACLPDRPMIFINACETGRGGRSLTGTGGMAEAFVAAGAGMVVAALWAVVDSTASKFARTFYQTLLDGRTLSKATLAGRKAARQALEPTWLAYTVYGHPYARLLCEASNAAVDQGRQLGGLTAPSNSNWP